MTFMLNPPLSALVDAISTASERELQRIERATQLLYVGGESARVLLDGAIAERRQEIIAQHTLKTREAHDGAGTH